MSKISLTLFLLFAVTLTVAGQNAMPFSCFNAEEIVFPLSENDFSSSAVLMNDQEVNAVYYLYQDRYSFWYKFVATEEAEANFSVSPSNKQDRYQALAFKSSDPDFCEKLVNQEVQPFSLRRAPIIKEDGTVVYRNQLQLKKGDVYLISVLSLNKDDCGHQLYIESGSQSLSINAIHRPCYNVKVITDIPDYDAAFMYEEDVDLMIDNILLAEPKVVQENPTSDGITEPTATDKKPDELAELKTIEIESSEEGVITVGDKLILNNVFFYTNTYAFKPDATKELNELIAFLKQNPGIKVEIQGHTANNTEKIVPDPNYKNLSEEWNFKGSSMKLSEKRADKVKSYLEENGIKASRMKTRGYGDTQKRVENAETFEESETNMRVEVLILKK